MDDGEDKYLYNIAQQFEAADPHDDTIASVVTSSEASDNQKYDITDNPVDSQLRDQNDDKNDVMEKLEYKADNNDDKESDDKLSNKAEIDMIVDHKLGALLSGNFSDSDGEGDRVALEKPKGSGDTRMIQETASELNEETRSVDSELCELLSGGFSDSDCDN